MPEAATPATELSDGDPLIGLDGFRLDHDRDPLEPSRLDGPHASLEAFLAERSDEPGEGCQPASGKPSVPPKTLPARGPVTGFQLSRARTGDSCNPTEHCFIRVDVAGKSWIGERLCAGALDAERELSTADTSLRWLKLGTVDAAAVEYTVTIKPKAKGQKPRQLRWLRLCGVGDSGKPSCTRPALTWCVNEDGSRDAATMSVEAGKLSLKSKSEPGKACEGEEGFTIGAFDVAFP